MDENQYDALSNFFRSKLNDDTTGKSGWNAPPDFVFEEAISVVNAEKKKKRRKFVIWFFLPILLMFLLAYLVHTNSSIDELNEKVHNLENKVQAKEQASVSLSPTDPISEPILNTTEKDLVVPEEIRQKKKIIQSFQSTPTNIKNNPLFIATNEEGETENVAHQDKTEIHLPSAQIEQPISQIDPLPIIKTYLNYIPKELSLSDLSSDALVIDEDKTKSWSVGFLVGLNISTLDMRNIPKNATNSLVEYDNFYPGLTLQTALNYNISPRLALTFGTGYSRYKNESVLDAIEFYDKTKETVYAPHNGQYKASMDIESPFGLSTTETSFSIDPEEVDDRDLINNHTRIQQNLDVLDFSIGAKYYPWPQSRIRAFTGAGLTGGIVLKNDNKYDVNISMDGKKMSQHEDHSSSLHSLNNSFIGYYIETGVEIEMQPRLDFLFNLGFEGSLNSLKAHSADSPSKTYLNRFKVKLGAAYKF